MRWSLTRNPFNRAAFARRNRRVRIELLESRQLMALTMLADINPVPQPAEVDILHAESGIVYFARESANEGMELWDNRSRTGVRRIKDILPGPEGFQPEFLLANAGIIYFTSKNPDVGRELWRTDGTEVGTFRLVGDVDHMTQVGGDVYFARGGDYATRGIWRTDGTVDGTLRVVQADDAQWLTPFRGGLAFVRDYDHLGRELWFFDPATGEATMGPPIFSGADSAFNGYFSPGFTVSNDILYFTATNGLTGRELWRSDGTYPGTYLLAEFNPGQAHGLEYGQRVQIVAADDMVYVVADDGEHGREIWRVEAHTGDHELVADLLPFESHGGQNGEPIFVDTWADQQLFILSKGSYEGELWRVGPTGAAVKMLDIAIYFDGGLPKVVNNELYFLTPTSSGVALNKMSSLNAEPVQLAFGAEIRDVTAGGNFLYFKRAELEDGPVAIWRSNGTSQGTGPATVELLGRAGDSNVADSVTVGQSLFFRGGSQSGERWLWLDRPELARAKRLDLQLARECAPDCSLVIGDIVNNSGTSHLYFHANSPGSRDALWRVDEFGENLELVSSDVTIGRTGSPVIGSHGDTLYFVSRTEFTGPGTLMKAVAGVPGATPVKTLPDGAVTGHAGIAYRGSFYFILNVNGRTNQLWRTDGTEEGTQLVESLSGVSFFATLTVALADDKLFVSVIGTEERRGIWVGDGTFAGSFRVFDQSVGLMISGPGGVYFAGQDATHGRELWFSDGVTSRMVVDALPGPRSGIEPGNEPTLHLFRDQVYFGIYNGSGQYDTWRTEGRAASAALFMTGARSISSYRDALFAARHTDEYGMELWTSDGTAEGTRLVADMYPGRGDGTYGPFAFAANAVYFNALTPAYGREPWKLTLEPGDTNFDNVVDLRDLNNVRNHFGESGLGDSNGDGVVDLADLNAVRNRIGDTTPPDGLRAARDVLFAGMAKGEEVISRKRAGRVVAK